VKTVFVVDGEGDWPSGATGAAVLTAREYLTDSSYNDAQIGRVVNLCALDRYQGGGHYVSMLADARGHRPLPGVKTIEDLHAAPLVRLVAGEMGAVIQAEMRDRTESALELDVYFGRDPEGRHPALAQQLFERVPAPLVRATLERGPGGWRLVRVRPVHLADVPAARRDALERAAAEFVGGKPRLRPAAREMPAIAILHNADVPESPSDPEALGRFLAAARALGMRAEVIDRHALDRLEHYDALFIRDTTHPGHYTYEFSRRAAALGLVVIDDPDSILQCNNKVYLNELLARHNIPVPKTLMVHRDNVGEIVPTLGLPCILKQPDSAFSLGVCKIETEAQLAERADALFEESELLVAQAWLPTTFDWRVGVLDRRVLYVCKYFMAPGHWQVIRRDSARRVEGRTAACSVGEAPEVVTRTALRAANLIGAGFYGVDLKQVDERCYVMEINDNPNIDAGNEDGLLKDALYREIMGVFVRRIREGRRATTA
jgi:glutathione synthase/RimK-type ligase-like ATP-grasp enzyme